MSDKKRTEAEVLIPERTVKIKGKEYTVRELVVRDYLKVNQKILEAIVTVVKSNPNVDFEKIIKENPAGLLPFFMPVIDRMVDVMAMCIGKEPEWVMNNCSGVEFSRLFVAAMELNNFGEMIQNFFEGLKKGGLKIPETPKQ